MEGIVNIPLKKKKLIELPEDVCRRLAIQAASLGTSVKKLIETRIIQSADDFDDSAVYAYLSKSDPEGFEYLAAEEQAESLSELRKKAGM